MKYSLLKNILIQISIILLFSNCSNSQVENETTPSKNLTIESEDSFISLLHEPYDKGSYTKKVFYDFSSENVRGYSDLNSENLEDIRILKLIGEKEINDFLSKKVILKNLEAIQVVNGKINKSELDELISYLANKEYLKKMILFNCGITSISPSINQLKKLETLDLSRNKISVLPIEILQLENLKYLRLYNNESFKEIPSEIGNLSNLELLDFAGTSISRIPKSIGNCKKLFHLTGNACKIKSLPKELGSCKNLKFINLISNQIEELPKELSQLTQLEIFSFGYNMISDIPDEYEKLTNLITFSVDNNKLTEFPREALKYKRLLNLWVHKNQIKDIPLEVANLKRLWAFMVDKNEFTASRLEEIKKLNPRLKIMTHY